MASPSLLLLLLLPLTRNVAFARSRPAAFRASISPRKRRHVSASRALSTTAYPFETSDPATTSGVRTSPRRSKRDEGEEKDEDEGGGGGGENEEEAIDEDDDEINRAAHVFVPLLARVPASRDVSSSRNIDNSCVKLERRMHRRE